MSHPHLEPFAPPFVSSPFRTSVFQMEEHLSSEVYARYEKVLRGEVKLDLPFADLLAEAIKEWALHRGATHYTHWFQPLTGISAEKHDSFLSWTEQGKAIERFRGKDLLCGEPDASSFPSGGLRKTHQARGYTTWDSASPPFLWTEGEGVTLCLPSLFFSWKGEALDHKIPLLRSDEKINQAGLRLLKLCGISAGKVFSTLGPEQEYFAIDRKWYEKRADLILVGRTVYGAKPAKGQELEDHYFGTVKARILAYMRDFEKAALELGIPVKTRHNEVAPSQYEVAPLFEPSSLSVDHNLLLMELMRQKAVKHGLVCLMHEKPFAWINGSGKHNNWSLATDTGLNLFDPKEESLPFLILLAAVLRAVHAHSELLRASVGSAGNDYRLGGSEAPPTILSVYLGEELEQIVQRLIQKKTSDPEILRMIDLGLKHVPAYTADRSDRNRTSFFAFTGNKFEFRAVGASAHSALPVTTLNAIVADSLHLICDEIADTKGDRGKLTKALPVIRRHLQAASAVIFDGDGYSKAWEKEAARRKLPNIRKSVHAFPAFLEKKSLRAFEGILNEEELSSRVETLTEQYAKTMNIEVNLMLELFRTQVLPAALQDQNNRGKPLNKEQKKSLNQLATAIASALTSADALEKAQKQTLDLGWEAKGKVFGDLIAPKMQILRQHVDLLEILVDHRLWPLPKYREMLFST